MSSNPYDSFGSPRGLDDAVPLPPRRVSVLAIMSLILSILCVTAPLGLICGGLSLIFISRSRGRLSGLGLAAVGTILGLILSVLMLLVAISMAQVGTMFNQNFTAPVATAFKAVEADDLPGVQAIFNSSAAAQVTPEHIAAFRTAYQSEMGSFSGVPDSLLGYFTSFGAIGQLIPTAQKSAPSVIPFAGYFKNGTAAIVLEVDQSGGTANNPSPGQWVPKCDNLGIVTPKHTMIWLLPRSLPAPGTPGLPPPATPAPPSSPGATPGGAAPAEDPPRPPAAPSDAPR